MSNDFNPGDVGINENGETVFGIEAVEGVPTSVDVLGRTGRNTGIRRLALVDYDSADDMVRLSAIWHAQEAAALDDDMHLSVDGWRLRQTLREFAAPAPAKPPEPTGLGAVVEDDKGRKWVRADADDRPWRLSRRTQRLADRHEWAGWSDIDVRTEDDILSEGVPS